MAHYWYWAMPNHRNYWKEAGYLDEMTAAEAAIAEGRIDRGLCDSPLEGDKFELQVPRQIGDALPHRR